jgi:hypothetical protein
MTTATDQFTEFAGRTQDAVTTAVRTWADTVQSVTTGLTGGQPALPDAHVVVERYFDFAQQVLDNQRAFAATLIDAGTKAAETVTEQATKAAESVTAHAVNATESVTAKAAAATKPAARNASKN